VKTKTEDYIREACLVAGFLMLAWGLRLIYEPAAWIACGALLIWLGLPPGPPKSPRGER